MLKTWSDEAKQKLAIGGIAVGLVLLFGVCCGGYLNFVYGTKDTITAKVEHKERTTTSTGETTSSYYLVYTDKEVFRLSDTLLYGQFSSSDIYGKLKVGQAYNFTVYGWRVPFFSSYRTIVEVKQ